MRKTVLLCIVLSLVLSAFPTCVLADATVTELKPLASIVSHNGSFQTVNVGNAIFTDRTYKFGERIPAYLIGKEFLRTGIKTSVSATVVEDGFVYVLTQVDGTTNSQEKLLQRNGFTRVDTIDSGVLWSAHKYKVAVMEKSVKAGETVTFNYWGLLIANGGNGEGENENDAEEGFELQQLATLMPVNEKLGKITAGERVFSDRTNHVFAQDIPEYLSGRNYLAGSVDLGGSFKVTENGYVYVITPVDGNSTSQADALLADGFKTVKLIDAGVLCTTVSEQLAVMEKKVMAGDTVSFARWGIVVANTSEDYQYADGSISLAPPKIVYAPSEGEYIDGNRLWQGIPSITKENKSGRLWATWYSGGKGEGAYNFALLYTSADDGKTWSGPVIAIDHEFPVRVFDPNLWVDPDGRMWMTWAQSYYHNDGIFGTWMMYTDDPESASPTWSAPVRVANGIAMNDPIVLSNGDWLLPTAIWAQKNTIPEMEKETNSNVYVSKDKGKSWSYLGSVPSYQGGRDCDENMVIEQADGSLRMLIRTKLGIEESYSTDGGLTWSGAVDADITNVVSRFYITRLSSGNQLLVFNDPPGGGTTRACMTAAISTDDGKTWPYKLVIDTRSSTSYPDAVEDAEGNIYIIYDCTRTARGQIVTAKITEQDIVAGKLVTEGSKLKVLINNNDARSAGATVTDVPATDVPIAETSVAEPSATEEPVTDAAKDEAANTDSSANDQLPTEQADNKTVKVAVGVFVLIIVAAVAIIIANRKKRNA